MPSRQRIMDLGEQIVVLVLYGWLVARLWPEDFSGTNWYSLLLLVSEGLVVLLLLIRRPTEAISVNPSDWLVAAGGTFLPLLVLGGGAQFAPNLGAGLLLVGLAVHVGAKLSLWRSFGLVAANRGLRVGGLYRVLRHPMYAGYLLTHIGFLLISGSWWNLAVYIGVWALLVARIFAEERILSRDPGYQAFKLRVRYRIVPGLF